MNQGKNIRVFSVVMSVIGACAIYFIAAAMDMASMGLLFAVLIIAFGILIGNGMNKIYGVSDDLKKEGVLVSENNAFHKEGLPGVGNENCKVCIRENDVYIVTKSLKFSLPYDKIVSSVFSQDYETIQTMQTNIKNKGTAGKMIVGGALFGVPGAIIGATSGSKSTSKTTVNNSKVASKNYLAINFYDKNNEINTAVFESAPFGNFASIEKEINSKVVVENNINENSLIEL